MPTVISGNLDQVILELRNRLNSPDLAKALGKSLSEHLQDSFSASLEERSGNTLRALEYISEPQREGNRWIIGVGKKSDLGTADEPAPVGTLREFFDDFPELRPGPWKSIPESYQDRLAQMRRQGMYGGKGPTYANYAWIQNQGAPTAFINATHFIDTAKQEWQADVPRVIDEWWSSLGLRGKLRATISGIFK
jgi:hypothetical protein